MICHYRGVSTQLSPPNHPSNPSSHHPPHLHLHPLNSTLQSSQNTPCIPQAAPVSLTALLLNLPLLPYTLPWEKMYPCERHTAHWAHCVDVRCVLMPPVYASTWFTCAWIHVYPTAELFVSIPKANRWSRVFKPEENVWIGPGCGLRNKTPADKPNTENSHRYTISVNSSLSSLWVIGHTLFHWMQLPLGHASVCEWDPRPLFYPPSTRLSQVVLCECVWGGLSAVTSYPQTHTNLLSIIMRLIITTDSLCIPQERRRGRRVLLTLTFLRRDHV